MITVESLKAAGYKHWRDTSGLHRTEDMYQKKVTDLVGVRYFINLWHYPAARYGNLDTPEAFQVECQLTMKDNEHLDLVYLYDKTRTIQDVESMITTIWKSGKMFDYYDRYNKN